MNKRAICTATIEKVTDGTDTIIYQTEIDDQTVIDSNNFQMSGMTSKAKKGSNAIVIMPNDSDRVGFVIATETTEYEISLEEGEMAIHTSADNYIKMKADGTVEVNTTSMSINGTSKTLVTTDELNTALQTYVTAINTALGTKLDGGGSPGTATLDISSASSQSITTN